MQQALKETIQERDEASAVDRDLPRAAALTLWIRAIMETQWISIQTLRRVHDHVFT
jgi:hypothetical protein